MNSEMNSKDRVDQPGQPMPKPAAIITVSRLTSQEESVQVTVNAAELTVDAIYQAVTCAGEALCQRVAFNNARLMAINDPIPPMNSQGGSA